MRKLDLTHDALKFLGILPPKQFRQVVTKVFALMANPQPQDSKPLAGYDYWRADIGEYRIVYRFDHDFLYVALVGKRNDSDIYKRLSRKG
ncbi:MAG: type II toxin-antitoxin system RelE family toxin [Candidatus Binataceae bacterium]